MFRLVSIIAILAAVVVFGLARTKRSSVKQAAQSSAKLGAVFGLLTFIATLLLTASGFRASLLDQELMTGLPLLVHVAAGSIFVVSLAMWALCRAETHRIVISASDPQRGPATDNLRAILWWCFVAAGLVTALTILASMAPIFGEHGMESLYEGHRWAALLLVTAGIGFLFRR